MLDLTEFGQFLEKIIAMADRLGDLEIMPFPYWLELDLENGVFLQYSAVKNDDPQGSIRGIPSPLEMTRPATVAGAAPPMNPQPLGPWGCHLALRHR